MAQPQPSFFPERSIPHRRSVRRNSIGVKSDLNRIDSSTLASEIQFQEDQRDHFYSLIALLVKLGLLTIALTSSLKLGFASHQRIDRNNEIAIALRAETNKLSRLQNRFDKLFSIGGKERLMEEQDQWIAPNSKRIIWR